MHRFLRWRSKQRNEETDMNRYEPSTPRAASAIAAVAMTAITVVLFIAVPAKVEPDSSGLVALGASKHVMPAPTEVVINPAHIDVVAAARAPSLPMAQVRAEKRRPRQTG
jgi:hypothetical protein